jgi:hypothetical protein
MRFLPPVVDPVPRSFSRMRQDNVGPIVAWWLRGVSGAQMLHGISVSCYLEDIPDILGGVAELAAGNAGAEVEVADGNAVVLEVVGKVVVALGHGTNKYCYALVLIEICDVIAYAHNLRIETERNLAAVGWKVVGDGVLDNLDELLL